MIARLTAAVRRLLARFLLVRPDTVECCAGDRGCGGAGYRPGEHGAPCVECDGTGRVLTYASDIYRGEP